MDLLKEIAAVAGAIIGVLTALVTLGAKLMDMKEKAAKARAATTEPVASNVADAAPLPLAPIDPQQIERARQRVKGPAMAIFLCGWLGLLSSIFLTCFGLIGEFGDSKGAKVAAATEVAAEPGADAPKKTEEENQHDHVVGAMLILMFFSPTVPSLMAIWAAFNMLRLRSYWLSVAGSFAIMPGGCMCCLIGVPIGIWSIMVLFDPEVSSSFN